MKSIIQYGIPFLVTGGVAHLVFGTPFNNGYFLAPVFILSMMLTMVGQRYVHWRRSRRGMPGTPGARANGADRRFRSPT